MPNEKVLAAFALSVSLFGLGMTQIIGISLFGEGQGTPVGPYLLGGLFGLLCILGIFAVLRPVTCNSIFRSQESGNGGSSEVKASRIITIRGHHPDCESYSNHVFVRGDRVYCAGCMGLLTGAVLALFGTTAFFLEGLELPGGGLPTLFIGGSLVAICLVHFTRGSENRKIRFVINAAFPLGAFLVLASVEQRTQSLRSGLFVLLIILFWVMTRVLLARWDHFRTCGSCESECSRKPAIFS
jgi:hypothetical protein